MSRPNSKQSMLHSGSNNSMHTTTATHILMVLLIAVLLCGQFFYFQRCRSDSFMINLRHNLGGSGGGGGSGSITPDSITTSTTGTNREKKEEPFFQGQHFDVCIAGAGLSGAVLAERYATELGYKVLVVEKRNHIGGNCYDYIDVSTKTKPRIVNSRVPGTTYCSTRVHVLSTINNKQQINHHTRTLTYVAFVHSHFYTQTTNDSNSHKMEPARHGRSDFKVRSPPIPHVIRRCMGLCTTIWTLAHLSPQSQGDRQRKRCSYSTKY